VCETDARLLATYDPAHSLAWPGAVPLTAQGELFDAVAALTPADAAGDTMFLRAGFTVRPIAGVGSRRVLEDFCRTHHYLATAGMAGGIAFGLYAPSDDLVGVAVFARPTNPRTAHGMFPDAPQDIPDVWAPHLTVQEDEVLDFVRLTVQDSSATLNLGTGAESYFIRAALRQLTERNRQRWRAVRAAELGWCPMDPALARVPWIKVVRSFADPSRHTGHVYRAAGWFAAGASRPDRAWIGERSGQMLSGRQRTKLTTPTDRGHLANVLRAAWEGGTVRADAWNAAGQCIATSDLAAVRACPVLDWRTFTRVWRTEARAIAPTATRWTYQYFGGGFTGSVTAAKPRFVLFLGAPPIARAIARRCRYLRTALVQADLAWRAPARRWIRGVGFNWPRRPTDVALLAWATRVASDLV